MVTSYIIILLSVLIVNHFVNQMHEPTIAFHANKNASRSVYVQVDQPFDVQWAQLDFCEVHYVMLCVLSDSHDTYIHDRTASKFLVFLSL